VVQSSCRCEVLFGRPRGSVAVDAADWATGLNLVSRIVRSLIVATSLALRQLYFQVDNLSRHGAERFASATVLIIGAEVLALSRVRGRVVFTTTITYWTYIHSSGHEM
jgi:hypothetical protein